MAGDGPFGEVPDNKTDTAIPALFNAALTLYTQTFQPAGKPVMVMVVQPGERNVLDQRHLEFALWDQYGVSTVRLTLAGELVLNYIFYLPFFPLTILFFFVFFVRLVPIADTIVRNRKV